jgi:diaminopimelate decarboxylase
MSHGFFVPRGRHLFRPIPRRGGAGKVSVRGPLPTNLDLFSDGEALGRPREGDLLLIGSIGAYNLIAANAWSGRVPEVVDLPG